MEKPHAGTIDLRSDTVTAPDRRMRDAMAHAVVGDNVLDADPTMAELERTVASLLDLPAALWMPSGTMANLVAMMLHLRRGDAFLAPRDVHIMVDELGTAASLAGGMPMPLAHDAGPGRPLPASVRAVCPPRRADYNELDITLLCLENTHNAAGGAITPPAEQKDLTNVARECGLRVHLDGARLWNAAVALGLPPAALTGGVDSVQVCLSKGLGAPVGSVLAGSEDFVRRARRIRQMLGGGVRQGGVLAAAGLVALDRIDQLADDHEKARQLAAGLGELGWPVNEPETNIVLAEVPDVPSAIARLSACGVLASEIAGRLRFVTHRDVSWSAVDDVLARIKTSQLSGGSIAPDRKSKLYQVKG
ncbi:threonine aldolase family protein [Amycolatopsis sp. NPDC059090]|uniref:threonine aldolase family protein n=1 Tax=Amycolatopsis sp. NPDC059090 TaxID=3346723 RepID=UPI00366B9FC8